jgi:hypothetical protein
MAEWRSELIGQLLRFPTGTYDDKIDTCSLIGRGLEFVKGTGSRGRAARKLQPGTRT